MRCILITIDQSLWLEDSHVPRTEASTRSALSTRRPASDFGGPPNNIACVGSFVLLLRPLASITICDIFDSAVWIFSCAYLGSYTLHVVWSRLLETIDTSIRVQFSGDVLLLWPVTQLRMV